MFNGKGSNSNSLLDSADEVRPLGGNGGASEEAMFDGLSKGLSNSHIRPEFLVDETHEPIDLNHSFGHRNSIIYFPGGQLIQVKQPRGKGSSTKDISVRGNVIGFSFRSRRRLMNLVASLERKNLPIFVTLTYPEIFPTALGSKRDLKVFIQRSIRIWPDLGYIWKLEFQKRGAPHYHLLEWGVELYDALKSIDKIWYEVCGTNDPKHLLAGTRVEKIQNYNGVMKYASKYLGKIIEEEIPEGTGRIWGKGGKIPIAKSEEYSIEDSGTHQVLRRLRRRIKTKNKNIRSFYLPYPERWRELHEDLTGDKVPF